MMPGSQSVRFRRTRMVRLSIPVAALLTLASGCYAHAYADPGYATVGSDVVVYQAPPAPRVVVRPPAPYVGAVWTDGYWNWSGGQYVWINGGWIAPRAGYVYAQPRWVRRGNGWVQHRGAWRRGRAGRVHVNRPHRGRGAVHVQRPHRGRVHVQQGRRGGRAVVRPGRPAPQRSRARRSGRGQVRVSGPSGRATVRAQ